MIQSVSSVSSNRNKDRAVNIGSGLIGAGIGMAMPYVTIKDAFTLQSPSGIKSTREFMQKMMPEVDTFENTAKNVQEILKETGLADKGVKFNAIDGKSAADVQKLRGIVNAEVSPKNKLMRKLSDAYTQMFQEGANAAYFPGSKDVVVNKDSLYSSAYHELGHAKNANGGFVGKMLQKGRNLTPFGVSVIAPVVLAVGVA